jgi:hypothetical protein
VEIVKDLRPKVFEPPGRVGKGLFEPVTTDIDMPDDLSIVGVKRRFALGIQRFQRIEVLRRVGFALDDGIPEELKDIVPVPPMRGAVVPRRILRLPEGRKTTPTAA